MKLSLRNLMAGLGTALFLAACGGGGGDDTPAVTPPTAVISPSAQSVPIGTAVTLDGSGSTTPNNGTITYAWNLSSRPDGSAVELSGTDATASFTPDVEGDYVAELTVNDGSASNTTTQTIAATNPDPVAAISPASTTVLLGNTVTLDGSGSAPPTGEDASALGYQWTLTEQPDGDTTTLADATASSVSFLAASEGVYKLRLVVTHGERSSEAEAEVIVNTANSSPAASAAVLIDGSQAETTTASNGSISTTSTITRGQTVTLDASASTDPDGDTLHYRWFFPTYIANSSVSGRPNGSSAEISNHTSAQASFVPDAVGTYYVDLSAYDNSVATTQRVTIKVSKAEGDSNTAPVAVIWPGFPNGYECEIGAYCAANGTSSYDLDGDTLAYNWVWWNTAAPDVKYTGTGSSLVDAAFTRASIGGTYTFELTVNDGTVDSATVSKNIIVKTGANARPTAVVSVNSAKVMVGDTITFNGSGSTDSNGDQLSYQWTLRDRPDGSTAVLQNATSASASVVADQPGIYTALLQVTDSHSATSTSLSSNAISSVFAKAVNNPPVIGSVFWGIASTNTGVAEGQALRIANGATTASTNLRAIIYDPDLDTPLYYYLTRTSSPDGSSAFSDVSNSVSASTGSSDISRSVTGLIAGDYAFDLVISDGVATSNTTSLPLSVVARENYPSLLLEMASIASSRDTEEAVASLTTIPQYPFPLQLTPTAGDAANVIRSYCFLTAFDQDYTITLRDTSTGIEILLLSPSGQQISDGYVIRKGETLTFKAVYAKEPTSAYEANLVVGVKERENYTITFTKSSAGSE